MSILREAPTADTAIGTGAFYVESYLYFLAGMNLCRSFLMCLIAISLRKSGVARYLEFCRFRIDYTKIN
jgi:hypothetical protein